MVVAMVASHRYRPQSCTTQLDVETMDGSAQLVALMEQGLPQLSGVLADAPLFKPIQKSDPRGAAKYSASPCHPA
jgi:hypothetical protein